MKHYFEIEKREAFTGWPGTEYVVHAKRGDFEISFWSWGRCLTTIEANIRKEYDNAVIHRKF